MHDTLGVAGSCPATNRVAVLGLKPMRPAGDGNLPGPFVNRRNLVLLADAVKNYKSASLLACKQGL